MLNIFKFILLLAIIVWLGMLVFFTFVVAPGIFKVLPRELAAELAAYLFPKYWLIGYASGLLSIISILVISFMQKGFPAGRVFLLALMTALTFYSGLFVSVKAAEARAGIEAADEPAKREALKEEFSSLHRRSSAINIAVMALGVCYVFLTARNLRS